MQIQSSQLEGFLGQFREVLPNMCATALAIDRQEPWERVAASAVEDGYIDLAEDFNHLVVAILRRDS